MTRYAFRAPDTGNHCYLVWEPRVGICQLHVIREDGWLAAPSDPHDVALARRLASQHFPFTADLERALRSERIDWESYE